VSSWALGENLSAGGPYPWYRPGLIGGEQIVDQVWVSLWTAASMFSAVGRADK